MQETKRAHMQKVRRHANKQENYKQIQRMQAPKDARSKDAN